ncbi:hypothetical protein [Candidatus Poriferisodalis sp.]|uniref:hypothetical protein n=1 Tax=Candidatus Poriferisodalis sp. TaxID=3101277 RepID=UPI003B01D39C
MAETQIVVEAWAVLIAAGAIVASMLGTSLGIMFHLAGRIDHQSGRIDGVAAEVAMVRERLACLEGSSGTLGPDPLPLA